MLNQNFNSRSKIAAGPKQSGQVVTNPRALAAIAIKNSQAGNSTLAPSPLAQALAKKKKSKGY